MRSTKSRAVLVGLGCLALIGTASRASEWSGSYAADGRCYCSGALEPELASRIVPTPIGGQSVATVCARVGTGPGLKPVGGGFDRDVYPDPQCGHGPHGTAARARGARCTDPGDDACLAVGPRWDLARAYARPSRIAAVREVAVQIGAGVLGSPAAVPAMGAASEAVGESGGGAYESAPDGIVVVGGRRWRAADSGIPEIGPPGTRIVVDGRVYLDAEQFPARRRARRSATIRNREPVGAERPSMKAATPEVTNGELAAGRPRLIEAPRSSLEDARARYRRPLAETREHLQERARAGSGDPSPASVSNARGELPDGTAAPPGPSDRHSR